MNKPPPINHKIALQASICAQDILLAIKYNTGKPWADIIYSHMEALFPKPIPRKRKRKKEIIYGINPYS